MRSRPVIRGGTGEDSTDGGGGACELRVLQAAIVAPQTMMAMTRRRIISLVRSSARRAAHRPAVSESSGCEEGLCPLFQVLAHQLRHLEHVDVRLAAEYGFQFRVRIDHPLVLLVLQAVLLDVG